MIDGGCEGEDEIRPYSIDKREIRLHQDGSLDSSFGDNGVVVVFVDTLSEPNSFLLSLAMDQKQRIVSVGASDSGITVLRCLSGISVGINEIPEEYQLISIYPNPASSHIHAQLPMIENKKIFVFNLVGEKVKEELFNNGKMIINVSDLPAGLYFVRTGETTIGKFVKE